MSINRNRNLSELTFDRKSELSGFTLPEVLSPSLREKLVGARLGPGAYNITLSTLSGPSFGFSVSTRFKEEDKFLKYMNLTRKASYQGFQLPEINFDSFRPSLKLSRIKEEADSLSNKLAMTRMNKRKIDLIRKQKILTKLQEKNEKFEIRRKNKEFRPLALKLTLFISILSTSFYINLTVQSFKTHGLKIAKFVRVFGFICLMIGKIIRFVKAFRILRAYRTLNKSVGRMKVWIFKKKNNYKSLVLRVFDSFLKKPMIHIVCRKVFTTVCCLQNSWRKALDSKNAALMAKIEIFKLIESSVLARLPGKKKYKAPKKVIIRELLKQRKAKLTEYNKEMKKHKRKCEMIERSHSKTALKVKCNYEFLYAKIPEIIYPKKPFVCYTLKKKKYIEMVHSLMHRRSLWD